MKEFMFLIRNEVAAKEAMPFEIHQEFLQQCKIYIEQLERQGRLLSAQPMVREGVMVWGEVGAFKEATYQEGKEVIVGYYHILARDLAEAVDIAKGNPEFAFSNTARIEVRPIKMKEQTTGYEYPTHG